MKHRFVIKNTGKSELGIMLEPWTDREDLSPGETLEVVFNFDDTDQDLTFDVEENFISIWCPPETKLNKI